MWELRSGRRSDEIQLYTSATNDVSGETPGLVSQDSYQAQDDRAIPA